MTPRQLPDEVPQLPGVAAPGSRVATVRAQPSLHQGWPCASRAMRCGVTGELLGSVERIRYSEMWFALAVSTTPMRATLPLFSVNHTRLGLAGSLPVMPYGLLLAVGVVKSVCACETGSNLPTALT